MEVGALVAVRSWVAELEVTRFSPGTYLLPSPSHRSRHRKGFHSPTSLDEWAVYPPIDGTPLTLRL